MLGVVFNYNGADTVTAKVTGATVGHTYFFGCSDPDSSGDSEVAATSSFTLTVSTVGGLDPGELFAATVSDNNLSGQYVGTTVFQIGRQPQYRFARTWDYDGVDQLSVEFFAEAGVTYTLTREGGGGFQPTDTVVGSDAIETLTITITGSHSAGDRLGGILSSDEGSDGFSPKSTRIIVFGTAGEGLPGNPEASPPTGRRFYSSPPWRSLVTNNLCETVTFLDRLARDRYLTARLKSAWEAGGTVPSDSPEVNILYDAAGGTMFDDTPFLDEGVRLLFLFRRDAPAGGPPWIPHFGGPILVIDDRGDTERGVSAYTAFSPWEYLRRRDVLTAAGAIPGANGVVFPNTPGSEAAIALLQRTTEEEGNCFIDYGQTAFYTGTIETTAAKDWTFRQGLDVGAGWDQLVASGTMDIELPVVYDPVNRPGICAQLSIYARAGADRHDTVIAWDKPSRNAVGFGHLKDGRARANRITFHPGQGGPAVNIQEDALSIAKYGAYDEQRFLVRSPDTDSTEATAAQQLALVKDGRRTLRLSPASERADVALRDYFPGDRIHAAASNRLREQVDQLVRVYEIPIMIADEGAEAVNELVVSTEDA